LTSPVPGPTQRHALEQVVAASEMNIGAAANYLSDRGISLEMANKYRLGVHLGHHQGYEQYRGRLTIPYLTQAGVVSVRFRSIDGSTPKYLSTQGDQGRLYNVNALFEQSDTLVITEGEFDALIVNECASVPAVGVPGASLWRPVFDRLVRDYPTLLVVGDGDEAGERFAEELAGRIGGTPIVLPDGEDVNSYYVKNDSMALIEVLGV